MPNAINYQNIPTQLDFNGDIFPKIIVNDGSITTLCEAIKFVKNNLRDLESTLLESGALLFRGFPFDSAEAFDAFSDSFGYPNFTYKESLSNAVRINYTTRVFTANEAPKEVEIYLHHEMAQTPISPSKLFFFCLTAAQAGGATPLCRSDKLFAELRLQAPELATDFASKGVKYITYMPAENDIDSGQGRSWKDTLSVSSAAQAETKLKDLGYTWEWLEDNSLRATTPILPAVIRLDDGTEIFYNQLIAAYLGWKGVRENPSSAIVFGDDSAIPKAGLDLVVKLSEEFTFDLQWQDGDIAIVDNYRAMHGRRPYSGDKKRVVLVALAAGTK